MQNTRILHEPASLPYQQFRSAVADAVVALDVQAVRPDDFSGSLTAHSSGDIQLLTIAADPHSVHRTQSLIQRSPQHYVKFSLVEQGSGMIVQDGRESTLSAGDMTVYDTDRPYSLICGDDLRMSVMMFPKPLLALPAEVVRRVTATRWDGASGIGAIVRPYVSSLARQIGDLDTHTARRLSRGAVDLVTTLLEDAGAAAPVTSHDTLLRRILDYIDEHLSSADLNPTAIAAAHFVSVRHLHALFSDQGTTVSTVIRNRRLERCYDQLIDPLSASRSVTTIALDNGFVDASHFSRTFRAYFGMPPGALRRERA